MFSRLLDEGMEDITLSWNELEPRFVLFGDARPFLWPSSADVAAVRGTGGRSFTGAAMGTCWVKEKGAEARLAVMGVV